MKTRLSIITSLVVTSGLVFGQAGIAQGGPGGGASRPPQNNRPPQNRPPQSRPPHTPSGPVQTLPNRPPNHNDRPPPHGPGTPGRPPQRPPVRPPHVVRPPVHRPGMGRPPNFHPVHGPVFHYPAGYRYRRWPIGGLLPSLFLSTAYIYSGYDVMGLGPPPPGYYWVRYGPDLLLVERRTRRIADVIYGAFR